MRIAAVVMGLVILVAAGPAWGQAKAKSRPPRPPRSEPVAAGTAWGQTITPITLDPKADDKPAAADITRGRLAAQGLVDGVQWSLSLQSSGTRQGVLLGRIADYLRQKPGAIRIVTDPQGFPNDIVAITVKDASAEQALKMLLGDVCDYVVQDDGSVFIAGKEAISHYVRRRSYEITEVMAAVRQIRVHAAPRDVSGGGNGGGGSPLFTAPTAAFSPDGENQEFMLLIKQVVSGTEKWSEEGGAASVNILFGGIMIVNAPEDMHQQIVTLCRSLLATAKLYKDAAQVRLNVAERQLAALRLDLSTSKEAVRKLYVKAGREEYHLTPQAIFAEAARAKPDAPKPEDLLALADQIEAAKVAQQDVLARIEAQQRLVHGLWEEVNDIPPKPMPSQLMPMEMEQESAAQPGAEPPVSADAAATASSGTAFACDLYPLLCKGDDNAFYSPFSISTALAMTWAGARGQTETQMAKVLHFGLPQEKLHPAMLEMLARLSGPAGAKKPYQLSVANALWGQNDMEIKPEFLDLTRINYGAEMQLVDFKTAADEARQAINAWVAARTQDKIKDLLQPPDIYDLTRLVLVNAIYFKSTWLVPFNKAATKNEPFTLRGGKTVSVPMMRQDDHVGYFKGKDFQAIALEYAGRQLSMIILLPDKVDGLADLEKSLTAKNLEDWTAKMPKKAVQFWVPRFKMTCRSDLAPALKTLGMTDAFSSPPADFSGIAAGRPLFISAAIHKAFVEVNEEGTEAAAATGIMISEAEVEEFATFHADHPFLFLIRHNATGSLLFVGRVADPTK